MENANIETEKAEKNENIDNILQVALIVLSAICAGIGTNSFFVGLSVFLGLTYGIHARR